VRRDILKDARRRAAWLVCSLPFLLLAVGCAEQPTNASFPVTTRDARAALGAMRDEPKPLARPLVILGGMNDPGFAAGILRGEFRRVTGDDRVIGVSFLFCGDFDACRRHVIAAVDRAFPSDDPACTTEVDVVGVSMGGLVARHAAVPAADEGPGARRLRIARLFTISSPHRGASLAVLPALSRLHADMRPDSPFLQELATSEAAAGGYEICPYVRLGDGIVGATNAAPHGQVPWWVPGAVFQDAHVMAAVDARIIADVARRLRGEDPLTKYPPQPLPGRGDAPPKAPAPPPAEAHADTAASGTTFAIR
jgi:pimeloyl-ACP methyl ester carboxylesterase